MRLFDSSFWVIEKNIESSTENIPLEEVQGFVSESVLENCP
jgi:hypothetical protein